MIVKKDKFNFSNKSKEKLRTVHGNLCEVCKRALSYGVMDFTIVQGVRSQAEQDKYYELGTSKVKWPNSKHNVRDEGELAKAVDIAPFVNGKISWKIEHCLVLAGLVLGAAAELGVDIRWGGNWDMDGEVVTDQSFDDLVHFELSTS